LTSGKGGWVGVFASAWVSLTASSAPLFLGDSASFSDSEESFRRSLNTKPFSSVSGMGQWPPYQIFILFFPGVIIAGNNNDKIGKNQYLLT
jgi:hypothetical protein